MLHVRAPLTPGEVAIDAHQILKVACRQEAHFRVVARQLLVVVRRRRAPVVRIARLVAYRRFNRLLARAQRARVHRALEDLHRRERVAEAVNEAQHGVVAPGCTGPQFCDGPLFRLVFQRDMKRAPDAATLRCLRHANHLDTKPPSTAAKLALEDATEGMATQRAALLRRQLQVQLRLAQRRRQAPLEIGAPSAAGKLRIERHRGVQIVARERAHLQLT